MYRNLTTLNEYHDVWKKPEKSIANLYWNFVEYATARSEANMIETKRQKEVYRNLVFSVDPKNLKTIFAICEKRKWIHVSIEMYLRDINDQERAEDIFKTLYLTWYFCKNMNHMFF